PGKEERVTVGRSACPRLSSENVSGTGHVFDDHWLPELARQPIANRPRHDVDANARTERHHELDRSRGPAVGHGDHSRSGDNDERKRPQSHLHHLGSLLSVNFFTASSTRDRAPAIDGCPPFEKSNGPLPIHRWQGEGELHWPATAFAFRFGDLCHCAKFAKSQPRANSVMYV